ncbi:MAG: peptide chain release factor N(5)-glutamine methyltransferase [Sulfurimonadaceae bacterium]|nr:peptide chain release factor N(5)-glutamine methyltransferase [Sulfurimonadaceae bacterium]
MSSRYLVKDILKETTLKLSFLDRAARESQLLLMHHLKVDELWLLTNQHSFIELSDDFFKNVARRAKDEPLEYITNSASFYSEIFYVDSRVLIPRPESELLIDEVLKRVDTIKPTRFVEVGVGSGIISIILAKKLPNATFIAVDISQDALEVARINIEKFDLKDRVKLRHGSLLDTIDEEFDYLVSNPPYIEDNLKLEKNLSYEPQNALFGGVVGDEIIKKLLDEALKRNISYFTCEMGYDQKSKIRKYLEGKSFKSVDFYKDLSDFDRGFTLEK